MKNIFYLFIFFIIISCGTKKAEKMIVYGSKDCHFCINTTNYLKENNIDFIFYDIDRDKKALNEMLDKLGKANVDMSNVGIPVIDKGGEIFTNKGDFKKFLIKLK
ncbi:glutaredoxin family protein [Polaribacter sp. Hel_I_88]|uniref:glutaredoxin family protein n=1 Tax=Polaribacter sp. Hel_I_88 TaxID=1250006 RepID=UPI0004794BE4|nr:glutaredoxin family protein [Polaribacter sp. Hel_I_88]